MVAIKRGYFSESTHTVSEKWKNSVGHEEIA